MRVLPGLPHACVLTRLHLHQSAGAWTGDALLAFGLATVAHHQPLRAAVLAAVEAERAMASALQLPWTRAQARAWRLTLGQAPQSPEQARPPLQAQAACSLLRLLHAVAWLAQALELA